MNTQRETAPAAARRRAPDPLRETRVLHRYVQLGVYGLLGIFVPIQLFWFGEPLKWALLNNAAFFTLAALAIEGAFSHGHLIRKRIAFPTAMISEMRDAGTVDSASACAVATAVSLMRLESAIIRVRGHDQPFMIRASGIEEAAAVQLIDSFSPTIDAARDSASITRVGGKHNQVVFVPLIGAHDHVGVLVLHAARRSDVRDTQTLHNIGARIGLHIETLWQKEQLTREQSQNEAVLAAIPDAILRLKLDGTITYHLSRLTEEEGKILPGEITGQNLYDLVPADLAELVKAAIARLLAGSALEHFEFKSVLGSGDAYREARIVRVAEDEVLAIVRDTGARRQAEATLHQREEYFRNLIENAHDPIVVVGSDCTVKYTSPAMTRTLGYDPDELVGGDALDLVNPEDRQELMRAFARDVLVEGAPAESIEFRARHKSGSWRLIEASVRPLMPGAQDQEIVVNGRDVTEQRQAADILRESEERMRTIFEEAPIGMAIVTPDMKVLSVNKALCDMLGYSEDQITELGVAAVTHPADRKKDADELRLLNEGVIPSYRVEKRYRTKDGEVIWGDMTVTVIRDADGTVLYALGMIENITDRKRAEAEVRFLAFHDPLTGLPNRALFRDRLELAIAQVKRSGQMAAVMFLDLDRFKTVNDRVGHVEGDRVLSDVAEKLSRIVREGDTISRVGGDEFTILLPTVEAVHDAVRIADRVLAELSEPIILAGKEFVVSASIGVTIIPDDGDDVDTLLRNADIAMYRAKEQGRNQYQLFAPHMNEAILERNAFEASLRQAIENEELTLRYQPVFDLQTMEVKGVEALVRWRRDDGTLLNPSDFLPVAEETGLIVPLGDWVLRHACRQAKAWQDDGLPPTRVAVNISAREFHSAGFVGKVGSVLKETGLDPSCLQLEVTAGAAMEEAEMTLKTLRQLKALGLHLALDDFGIGYSSIRYLKRFPIDALKIDSSFVSNLGNEKADAALVGAIITMAHSLGIRVIAEGVEAAQQLRLLRDPQAFSDAQPIAVCDEFQGFLAERPLPAAEIAPLLRAGRGSTKEPAETSTG